MKNVSSCETCFAFSGTCNGNIWRLRIFAWYHPGHFSRRFSIAKRNRISDESYLGEKYNLNASWSSESKLHTRNARSSTPLRSRIILRQPLLHPLPVRFPFIARYPSCTAQHMHTKYIKRPAPVPKYGVVYSRVVWGRERRASRLVRFTRILNAPSCFITTTRRWRCDFTLPSIAKQSNCEHITVILKMKKKVESIVCGHFLGIFQDTLEERWGFSSSTIFRLRANWLRNEADKSEMANVSTNSGTKLRTYKERLN